MSALILLVAVVIPFAVSMAPTCTVPPLAQGTVAHTAVAQADDLSGRQIIPTSIDMNSEEGGTTLVTGYVQLSAPDDSSTEDFGSGCGVVHLTQTPSVFKFGFLVKYACNGTCLWVRVFRETSWFASAFAPQYQPGVVLPDTVRTGRDASIYLTGTMGCLGVGQNVTFANLTWSPTNPLACDNDQTAFILKFNSDATTVLWYYFTEYPQNPNGVGAMSDFTAISIGMRIDKYEEVYWMFTSQAHVPVYLTPNASSNHTAISTTWSQAFDSVNCVIVKMAGANGRVRWWNVFGIANGLGTAHGCTDIDVAYDGTTGALAHYVPADGVPNVYPCNVAAPASNSNYQLRISTFDGLTGQCTASAGFGNGALTFEATTALAYSPQSSLQLFVRGTITNTATACLVFPPLPAMPCIKTNTYSFVARLNSTNLKGIWANSLAFDFGANTGSIDVDGNSGVAVSGYASTNGAVCYNAAVYCNASNALFTFDPLSQNNVVKFAAKFSTANGALEWVSAYISDGAEANVVISAYGREGYGMWATSFQGQSISNGSIVFGDATHTYSPQSASGSRAIMPVVFNADTQYGVGSTMAQTCDTCMHLYDTNSPMCTPIAYEGNTTWASVASGTRLDTDIVDIQASFIHTDGTVYVAGRINTALTANLNFGGNCGLVGVGPVGNPFLATYDSCTGRCLSVSPYFAQTIGTVTSIQVARDGTVLMAGNIDCLATTNTKMCLDASTSGYPSCVSGSTLYTCQNSTSNKYIAWVFALQAGTGNAIWNEIIPNQQFSTISREIALDDASPVQTLYWMTQLAAGPLTSGHGILASVPTFRNPGGNGWASGLPVDCVLWSFNTATGAMGFNAAYGDSDPSYLKQCRSMVVTADGTRVAIAMTTSGAAVTLEPCGVFYPGGTGVDTRVVYINTANFACITTTVFSSAGVFDDSPWRLAFGLHGNLFVVGQSDHTEPGVGMTFPPLQPLTQGHQMDGWIALLEYSAAANNLSGVWAHSISSDGQDASLDLDTDGHYGVVVGGVYASTYLCLDVAGYCGVGSAFASNAVNNTQIYMIKFDAISGAKLWHRLYTTNTSSPTLTRTLSISSFGLTGYGFWSVTGSGHQIQQSQYVFGDADHVYTPSTANATFGFVTKHLDTDFGISNFSVADGCTSAPCQNSGTCSVTYTDPLTPLCTCVIGFSGVFCQTNINECASSPCTNGAQCIDGVNGYYCTYCFSAPCQNGGTCVTQTPLPDYICTCAAGYSGRVCQTSINECDSSPCQNGGSCVDALNQYSCTCATGYSGPVCQTNIDECASSPCQNGGTCADATNRYSCVCAGGFSGILCQTDINECASSPCQNSGSCTDGVNLYTCTCQAGYSGFLCQTSINECASNPCFNSGTCTDALNSYSCTCAPGYSGKYCQTNINECSSSPCQNGGSCSDSVNRYSCVCAPGYSGVLCQTNIDECASSPCQNSGTCTDSVNSYICTCVPGFSGGNCQTNINECASNPCFNSGTCTDATNQYSCVCAGGYSGVYCQTNINECGSSPCLNSGTCVDGVNAFSCTCVPGYSGITCQTQIDECASLPCKNGGSCVGAVNGFSCNCLPGFSGTLCQTNINECASFPCLHSSSCTDGVNSFSCVCTPGYSGKLCQTDIDDCASTPCQNSGTCVDAVNRLSCVCVAGYSGQNCQTDVNECASSPCLNSGTCVDATNLYTCTCASGYSGTLCQTNINECASNPCFNGGTCTDALNRFACACVAGYSGAFCQTNINECASQPCRNGGTCYDMINSFYCACIPGYKGSVCQSDVNECSTSNGGCDTLTTCNNTVGSRTCSACPTGYTGTGATHCFPLTSPCGSTPCQNGGTCVPDGNGASNFTCTCPVQFTDTLCQTDVNECATLNGGCDPLTNCTNLVGSFGCGPCPFGYTGNGLIGCTSVDSACESAPCQNGGTCNTILLDVMYNCTCPSGFLGSQCQTDINECATASGGCDSLTLCVNTPGSRICSPCPTNYVGTGETQCIFDINECLSHPCQNGGTCNDFFQYFTCVCAIGFTGYTCQTNINECDSNPCHNGGTCVDGVNRFTCVCDTASFLGTLCQTGVQSCTSQPCQNSGVCSVTGGGSNYTCTCLTGYVGLNCQTNIDECASFPCQNGGNCTDLVNGFTCNCTGTPGTGAYCQHSDCDSSPCQNGATCHARLVTNSTLDNSTYKCVCPSNYYVGRLCETFDLEVPLAVKRQDLGRATALSLAALNGIITLASIGVVLWYWLA